MPKRIASASEQCTVRFDAEMLRRIDVIADEFATRLGIPFNRSDAIRLVVARGVRSIESDVTSTSVPGKPGKKRH